MPRHQNVESGRTDDLFDDTERLALRRAHPEADEIHPVVLPLARRRKIGTPHEQERAGQPAARSGRVDTFDLDDHPPRVAPDPLDPHAASVDLGKADEEPGGPY